MKRSKIDDEYIGTKCNSNVFTVDSHYYGIGLLRYIDYTVGNSKHTRGLWVNRLLEKKNHKNMKTGQYVFAIS